MFECRNCGAEMKFSATDQQLVCEYCNAHEDPYSYEGKEKDAVEEKDSYQVTIFTCPQCGGEILSTDNAIAGFCSFCGGSTVLYNRIQNEKRPKYIIPFKLSKEDCKQAYSKYVKRAFFAPKEIKDTKFIDSFRGIYMPYWAFHITQQGSLSLNGTQTYRRGDYVYTDHYNLGGYLDAYYKGLSYDASSSFADEISEAVAPFDVKGMKAFTPAYLSGYYADLADVSPEVYRRDAEESASDATYECIKNTYRGFTIPGVEREELNTVTQAADLSMFPVWFMSYRNGNRVTYATVNGQNGKVVADLPVDIKKYALCSLVLALPIFLLLNLFFTVLPTSLLNIILILLLIMVIVSNVEVKKITQREDMEYDRGYLFRKKQETVQPQAQAPKKKKRKTKTTTTKVIGWVILIIFLLPTAFALVGGMSSQSIGIIVSMISIFAATIAGIPKMKKVPEKKGLGGFIAAIVVSVIAMVVYLIKPVADYYYYGTALLCLIVVFWMIYGIIHQYNILSTRRLPQFDKQGGDNRA